MVALKKFENHFMYDLLSQEDQQQSNVVELTVSELSSQIKLAIEGAFPRVKVRGEISGFKRAPSGHIYMNLKDENANLAAVCWRGQASKFRFKPEEGMEVIATGNITTYGGQSKYQLVIDNLEPAGLGALMALLEKRKEKLTKEGLFDQKNKKPIPAIPKIIGVVTSPTGAVIKDILHRIEERFATRVIIWPVLVQGEKAAGQISSAINGFNNMADVKPDVIIVARGGGSVEDLWAFNEEEVVRAAANSKIPLISAIGHETDFTLIDYAADLRAPTPTAAAEKAVPVKSELIFTINDLDKRNLRSIFRIIDNYKKQILSHAKILPSPKRYIEEKAQRLDNVEIRIQAYINNLFNQHESKILMFTRLLDSYHYKKVLDRGFTLIRDNKDKLIKSSSKASIAGNITIEFADGQVKAQIGSNPAKKKAKHNNESNQGSLF